MFDSMHFFGIFLFMPSTKKSKLTSKQLLAKREEVVALHKRQIPVMEIVKATGLSWPAVNRAIKLFQAGGMDALQPKTGRTEGSGRILSPVQEDEIREILYTKQPREIGIIRLDGKYYMAPKEEELTKEMLPYKNVLLNGDSPQYLWCRDSIKELVNQVSGIELSPQAINDYLCRWGCPKTKRNQRPISKCSQAIQYWMKGNPLKKESPKRYWLYRERLHTEIKQSKISATDDHRKEFWTIIQGNFSQKKQIDFLWQLNKQSGEQIVVVRHDYNHYTKKEVSEWLSRTNITLQPPLLKREIDRLDNDTIREAKVQKELLKEFLDKQGIQYNIVDIA